MSEQSMAETTKMNVDPIDVQNNATSVKIDECSNSSSSANSDSGNLNIVIDEGEVTASTKDEEPTKEDNCKNVRTRSLF